jgi:hypothetical protein
MALVPIKPAQVPLEYTSATDIDFANDVLLLGSTANSNQVVRVAPSVFRDALALPTATEAFTASDTLTTAESGKWCDNIGAVIAVTLTAPASPTVNECEYTLERVAGYAFRFKPGSGHTVNGGTADKYVELQSTGLLTFRYIRSGEWVIVNDSAAWNFEP